MNQQEHFNRSVAALVKAYFEGVLEATDCAACACGNLVAAANGYKVSPFTWLTEDGVEVEYCWQRQVWWGGRYLESQHQEAILGLAQIASTGYTVQQFAAIEQAFMGGDEYQPTEGHDAENFKGLLRTVDVLADIHGIDLATATAAKELFVRA